MTLEVKTKVYEAYYDWWGYFVLPDNLTVKMLIASGSDTVQLGQFNDYTINHVENYNIVITKNEPTYKEL